MRIPRSAHNYLLFVFFFISLSARGQYDFLAHKTYAERYVLMDSLFFNDLKYLDSDVVFRELKKLSALAAREHDHELQMEAEFMRIDYYFVGKQKNHELFEKKITQFIGVADKEQVNQMRIRTRVILAGYYFNKQKYGLAFENYLEAYELTKQIDAKDFPNKQEIIDWIGGAYYNIGDYTGAYSFLMEARQYPTSYKPSAAINAMNTLALIFRSQSKYDSAIYYFQKAYAFAKGRNDSTWMGITSGNIGITYFLQGRYEDAIPLLELDVKESTKVGEIDNGVTSLLWLIEIRLIKGDIKTAETEIAFARQLIQRSMAVDKHRQKLYYLLSRLSAMQGNMTMAYHYADSSRILKDTITNRVNALVLSREEKKIEMQKYIAQVKLLSSEKKLYTIVRNSLIGGLFLLALIAVLIIRGQRIKHKQERNELYLEKRVAQAQLELAKSHLNDFTRSIREKNELMDQFAEQLDKLQTEGVSQIDEDIISMMQQATILSDEQWEEFRQMFDMVHKGYLTRLKEKFPELSPTEIRFITLNKLKLTGKEMATVMGVGADAIRQYRHRLRKKLGLSEEGELAELVDSI